MHLLNNRYRNSVLKNNDLKSTTEYFDNNFIREYFGTYIY